MDTEIAVKPIGIIHTPYKTAEGMPIQGAFAEKVTGKAELFQEYKEGLKDIEGFSHLILIYYFDRAKGEKLLGKPFLEDEVHGIFSIRSPMRPNHIGISIVKIKEIEDNVIIFSDVDILDETPLLDIKPYVAYFDSRENTKNGWLEKHFVDGKIPKRTKII
ncbi:MAG: tRNA (N6-threonylcarbamoyladenosine(37)-N6)-methyltransferase TrmO [Candidatus Omnitrophota bacterium]